MKKKLIYVVIHVHYDYYRFQENMGATTSLAEARTLAHYLAKSIGRKNAPRNADAPPLPVIEDAEQSQACEGDYSVKPVRHEVEHIYIETFKA